MLVISEEVNTEEAKFSPGTQVVIQGWANINCGRPMVALGVALCGQRLALQLSAATYKASAYKKMLLLGCPLYRTC